jgi:hypothetical protein
MAGRMKMNIVISYMGNILSAGGDATSRQRAYSADKEHIQLNVVGWNMNLNKCLNISRQSFSQGCLSGSTLSIYILHIIT